MSHGETAKRGASTLSTSKTRGGASNSAAAVDPLDPSQLDVSVVGWGNLEQKFNELRGLLSAPAAGLNANQARALQKQRVSAALVHMLDRAQQDCRRLLIEGNAKAAVEGGLKTLRLKEAYYGHGHLQLVPAYFHLARTNQYMDKFKAAEEFLSLAQWTILRNRDVDVSLKAELHQTFGLLYASDSKLDAALKQLTCATYYLCVMNGPEHILTSFGYFDLGNVFAAKSNMEHAMAFYDKVKDVWHTHLSTALRRALEPTDSAAVGYAATATGGSSGGDKDQGDVFLAANFGLENLQDAVKMLRGIVGLQTERYGRVHPSTARAEYVLGMFMLWNGDAPSATGSLLKAMEISKRVYGERHPSTQEIRSLMLNFRLDVPDDTTHVLDDDTVEPVPATTTTATTAPAGPAHIPTPPKSPKQPAHDAEGEAAGAAEDAAQEPAAPAVEGEGDEHAVENEPEADATSPNTAEPQGDAEPRSQQDERAAEADVPSADSTQDASDVPPASAPQPLLEEGAGGNADGDAVDTPAQVGDTEVGSADVAAEGEPSGVNVEAEAVANTDEQSAQGPEGVEGSQ